MSNTPILLDGKTFAKQREQQFLQKVEKLKTQGMLKPILATILVGDDPASATYVNMKGKACARVGMESKKVTLPKETTTQELLDKIDSLNQNHQVSGILLQHPVPVQIDERACFNAIDLTKDVDGVTSCGFGKMAMGEDAYGSATPLGIMSLLKEYKIDFVGKHAVVVGRSAILGKPMAAMLLNEDATVTICHSKTKGLEKWISQADLVVAAVGIPNFVKGKWIKDGAVVIDAGYHPQEKCGDVELQACLHRVTAYTPVPGGVGPMTISTLIEQTVIAAEKQSHNTIM